MTNAKPVQYQFKIKGVLPTGREAWFEGLSIRHFDEGITVLQGSVRDQSDLFGILAKIRDLGMELISVNPIDSEAFLKNL